MNTKPRDVLVEIMAEGGDGLLTVPGRLEAVLKDYCGEFRREIFVLVSCQRVNVPEQLQSQGGPSIRHACARLAHKLEQNLAISSDAARWGVESWAIALGLMDEAQATPIAAPAAVSAALAETQPLMLSSDEEIPRPRIVGASVFDGGPEFAVGDSPEPEQQMVEEEPPPDYIAAEPVPLHAVPDWAHPVEQITVHPDSAKQRPTLKEAVRDAASGACLILKPGLYKETFTIEKDLQIRSGGEQDEVILESTASSVFILNGGCLLLAGLNLRGVSAKDKKPVAAIEVRSGHLVMEDCDLTSEVSNLMEVKGPQVRGYPAPVPSPRWEIGRHHFPGRQHRLPRGMPSFPEQAFAHHHRQGLLAGALLLQDQQRADGRHLRQRRR